MTPQRFYFGTMFWAIIGVAVLMATVSIPLILKFAFGVAAGLFVFFVFVGKRRYRNDQPGRLPFRSQRNDEYV